MRKPCLHRKGVVQILALLAVVVMTSAIGCVSRPLSPISCLHNGLPYKIDPQDNDVMIYSNPRFKVTTYSKFLIEPVKIYSNDSFTISRQEEAQLAEMFREELIHVLGNGYEVVKATGPQVLRIRIGIQDIQPADVRFAEQGAVVLRLDTMLARAAMELDCLDSVTGDHVVALIHTLHDVRYFERNKKARLLNIRDAFRIWATALRKRFDAGKARSEREFDGTGLEHRRLQLEEGN